MEEIALVDVEPQHVVGIRKRGKYEEIPDMIRTVYEYVLSQGAASPGCPIFVMHETSEEEAVKADLEGAADIEITVPVTERLAPAGGIACYELPGGRMARVVHRGPYKECGPTYERLFAWLAENGLEITGPIREVYLNDPREVPEAEILTEIFVPVA